VPGRGPIDETPILHPRELMRQPGGRPVDELTELLLAHALPFGFMQARENPEVRAGETARGEHVALDSRDGSPAETQEVPPELLLPQGKRVLAGGVPHACPLSAVSGTNADSAYLHYRAAQLTGTSGEVLSPVRAAVKDLGHIRSAASSAGIPDLLLPALEQIYLRAADAGLGDRDLAAVRAVLGAALP
jgi:hypothetical protein